jgi:hypothetical protein
MTWPPWLRQQARDFVQACTGPDWPGRPDQAQRLLEELDRRDPGPAPGPRRASPSRPRTGVDKSALPFGVKPSPTKAERNAPRNERVWDLRRLVLRRARGRCEFRCIKAGEPTEAHHVFGGADRRLLEGPYTMAGICDDCHDRCDESPAWARQQALLWARRMAGEAHLLRDDAAAAGFRQTAELLEGRIALAAAQARPVTTTTEDP